MLVAAFLRLGFDFLNIYDRASVEKSGRMFMVSNCDEKLMLK